MSTHHDPRPAPRATPEAPLYGAARRDNAPSVYIERPDELAPGHTRFVATVAYDGTDYLGWQSQPNGKAVQDVLEARLSKILRTPMRIYGSSRTDSGVHAEAQVFHFDAEWRHSPAILLKAFHCDMPSDILVTDLQVARPHFHARFSSAGKRYEYRIRRGFSPPDRARYEYAIGERTLDVAAMCDAAARLVGVHDFTAFGGTHKQSMAFENPIKDLRLLDVREEGPLLIVTTEAGGYLYKMVRRLVGGLLQVGMGRMTPARLEAYRDERCISAEAPTAPARGLSLTKVYFSAPKTAEASLTPDDR